MKNLQTTKKKKLTPREELERLKELNKKDGYYGTYNQFVILIESRLRGKAIDLMNNLNTGFLWVNERMVFNKIYNLLLDGTSIKDIKKTFKTC